MPTYNFECTKCKNEEEKFISMNAYMKSKRNPLKCSECKGDLKSIVSSGSTFVLKGGNWASDGYGK